MNSHLTPRQMLAYIDGELSRAETRHAEKHLHSCWTCLTEMERLKGDIATILDAENEAFAPALPPPPHRWPGFDTILARKLPVRSASSSMRFIRSDHRLLTPARTALASALAAVFVIGIYAVVHTRSVSAKEVLQKMEVAETQRSRISRDQVIRQRIRVRRIAGGDRATRPVKVETWKSPHATYWNVEDSASVAADLQSQYRQHNIPADLPLSSVAAESWGMVAGGRPTVEREGADMDLIFPGSKEGGEGAVERVRFLIQPEDWHLKQMTLDLPGASFEVTEDDYAVMPVSAVPVPLLAYLEPPLNPPTLTAPPRPVGYSAGRSIVLPAINLDAVELEVFTVLHAAKADLGDPVSVTRSGQEVHVGLWQLPPERQSELRAPLAAIPGVQVHLRPWHNPASTGVVLASAGTRNPSGASVQIETGSDREDQRLLRFFGSPAREQDFTNQALGTTSAILSHLYAVHNLASRFSSGRDQQLAPEDRERLHALVQDHLTAVSASLDDLKRQFDPLIADFSIPDCTSSFLPAAGNWQSGAERALETSRAINHILSALLTTNQTPAAPDSALPQIGMNLCRLRSELDAVSLPNSR